MRDEENEEVDIIFKSFWKDEGSLEEAKKEVNTLAGALGDWEHSLDVYALAGDACGDRLFLIARVS